MMELCPDCYVSSLRFGCPTCKARPGQPCRNQEGRPLFRGKPIVHNARPGRQKHETPPPTAN